MDRPTPRVNSAMLHKYHGHNVRLIGKVVSLEGSVAVLQATDNGQVTVKLGRDSNYSDPYVEVIGRVEPNDNSITEFTSMNLGTSFDIELAEKVIQLTHKYPNIFPTDE